MSNLLARLFKFYKQHQTVFLLAVGVVFVFNILFLAHNQALAAFDIVNDIVVPAVGFIASLLFSLLGKFLTAIISALISIAGYNKIIGQPTVVATWGIMRDFVNMFFVFAVLLIAFSTILRIHDYEAKRLLPRLIIYAVLVNFSLTICGLFIDIAQVVMMTFVNAFQGSALNNLTTMTGLLDYGKLQLDTQTVGSGEVLAGYVLSIFFMLAAIITIGAMLVILLIRILMLWILAILSPFAFVLAVMPKAEKYAGQWWSMFSNYVVSGPLLAFFIWLALTVVGQNTNIGSDIVGGNGVQIVKTAAGNSGFFINFLIAIGMLFAGLMLTAQLGSAMGKIAGTASSKMQSYGTTAGKWAARRIGVSGAIGAGATLMTGGLVNPITGAAAGMAVRTATRFGLRTERGQRSVEATRRGLETIARTTAGIPIIGSTVGRTAVALRGTMRRRELQQEKETEQYLKRRTPAELTQVAHDVMRPSHVRQAALEQAPWAASTPGDVQRLIAGYDRSQLKDLKRGDFERIIRTHPTITRANLDTWVRANQYFSDLSNNERDALAGPLGGPPSGRVHTPPVDPVSGAPLSNAQLFGQRWFGEISEDINKGDTYSSDIVAADMVVKADHVNLTGDKAGSTLGKDLGDPGKTSGVASLLRRGLKDGVGRLAIDFNRLGLTGAGVNLIGNDKTKMIPKIMDQLRTEGYAPAQLQSVEQELQKAQSLSLINKTRDKGDTRKIIAHEAVHDMIDDNVSVEERREMWDKMTPEKRESLEKSIRANWTGGDKMSQDQVIEEYFANGLTNETRWGDKSEKALKLDEAVRDELNKKGLIKKVNEGLITKKEIPRSGTLETEEEFKKHNEALRGQAATQVSHQTLTEKAAQEEGVEITGEEGSEKAEEEKEDEEEKKKEEKSTKSAPSPTAEVRTMPQVQSVVKQVMESSAKGMPDPKFFRLMFTDLNKTIGMLGSKLSGAQYEQTSKLSKLMSGLQEASQHAQSDNPLIRQSAKQEFDVKLEEFKKEYYNITEAPASEQEIEKAIGDIGKQS